MNKESAIVGVAGVFFGVLVGWIVGSQVGGARVPSSSAQTTQSGAASSGGAQAPPPLDEARAGSLAAAARQNPDDADTRVQLGNVYFDAGRYREAARWYEAALKLRPRDVNVSTDLGITYYYMNDPDRALAQFDASLAVDPSHAKTLLNVGIVRAFGKQDMKGAAEVWQKVLAVAPASEEAAAARQALDGLRSAHPDLDVPAPGDGGRGTPKG